MSASESGGVWRAVRLPVVVLVAALVLLAVATVLDRQPPGVAHEAALTIGAPALAIVLPLGLIWLVVALVLYGRRRRR